LDKHGLKVNTNWKSLRDWEPLLSVIKDKEPDICPLLTDGFWNHLNPVTNYPCDLVFDGNANDAVIKWIYDFPWYMHELRTIRSFYLKGYIPEATLHEARKDWTSIHISRGNFFLFTEALKPAKGKSTELMAALSDPGIIYDEFETYPYMVDTRHVGGSMLAIPKTSENPVKAMQFINEMHVNPELTNLLAWGIEGKQYTVVSENPKRVKPIENNSWSPSVLVWTLGNQFNVHLSELEPEDKYIQLAATKVGVPEHISNGYRFDPAEYQDIITIIKNIHEEYSLPIRLGVMDPDKGVAALRAEIDKAGFQEVKAAVIADFQRWLKESR
jgi:putative aldouronate transport system substrate-binding protein